MTKSNRRPNPASPERRVWVFSELTPDLAPSAIARILAGAALQAAEDARRTAGRSAEGDQP